MRYVLLHPPMWRPDAVAPALETSQVEPRVVRQARDLAVVDDRPTVLLLDADSRSTFPVDVMRGFVDAGGAIVALGREGEADVPETLPTEFLSGFLTYPTSPRRLLVAIRAGFREAAARAETARARGEAAQRAREIGELTRIGVALGTERDIKTLLELILTQARRITQSDAGSLYLVELSEEGKKRMRFRLAQTYSKPDAPFVEFTIPVDRTSLAGYCAVTGDPLVIDDAYFLPPDVEYTINRTFDERYGYRTKSMLVIPMKDHKDEIIGVLQLINRKRNFDAVLTTPADTEAQVVPFSKRTVELVTALAGAIAVRFNSILVAVLGIIGGYGTPIVLSTGAVNFPGLYGYMLVLGIGVLGICYWKNWPLLSYLSFVSTYALFFASMRDYWQAVTKGNTPAQPHRPFALQQALSVGRRHGVH